MTKGFREGSRQTIAEGMRGTARLESELGSGSRFLFTVAAAEETSVASVIPRNRE
jgi:signal transduction histidine kinase